MSGVASFTLASVVSANTPVDGANRDRGRIVFSDACPPGYQPCIEQIWTTTGQSATFSAGELFVELIDPVPRNPLVPWFVMLLFRGGPPGIMVVTSPPKTVPFVRNQPGGQLFDLRMRINGSETCDQELSLFASFTLRPMSYTLKREGQPIHRIGGKNRG